MKSFKTLAIAAALLAGASSLAIAQSSEVGQAGGAVGNVGPAGGAGASPGSPENSTGAVKTGSAANTQKVLKNREQPEGKAPLR